MVARAAMNLDMAALKYRHMLYDPCNAPLVPSVYSGLGTGQYRRLRSLITSPTNAVEGCIVIQLSSNSFWQASHVQANVGTNYTFNAAQTLFPSTALSGTQIRALAGCVKVRFVGAESNRSGTVGVASIPGTLRNPTQVSTALQDLARCPVIHRLGEVLHEAKYIPGDSDEVFNENLQPSTAYSTIMVVYRGVPATSIQIETTAIYEIEVNDENMPVTGVPSPSSNTLNQVLKSLGPAINWAYGTAVAPVIKAAANGVQASISKSVYAAANAVPLLTL